MTYRKSTIWDKPMPRLFGLLVLLLSIGTIFWLSRNVVLFGTKAALGNTPKDIQVTNITEKSFTVSYLTDEDTAGTLNYGTTAGLGEVAFDTRDSQTPAPHRIHYITVNDLKPNTKYYFSIASGGSIFQNDSVPFETSTAKSEIPQSSSDPTTITGKVTIDGTSPPEEGLVYVKTKNSQAVSALVSSDGEYKIELSSLLKNDLSENVEITPETLLEIRIADPILASKVSLFASFGNPVPPVILSKDYDFTLSGASTTNASDSAQVTGFPQPAEETVSYDPVILTPKTDEKFTDQQPLFAGKAPPGANVEITIESEPITTTVQTDENGAWQFRPDTKLEPGVHKITIRALSPQGILQTITRQFTVFAQGSQFTEPSISPSLTISPMPTPLPTRAPIATPTPTTAPTATPTPQPTVVVIVPTGTQVTIPASPSAQIAIPSIPPSGSSVLVFGLTGMAILIGIGSLLFFLL